MSSGTKSAAINNVSRSTVSSIINSKLGKAFIKEFMDDFKAHAKEKYSFLTLTHLQRMTERATDNTMEIDEETGQPKDSPHVKKKVKYIDSPLYGKTTEITYEKKDHMDDIKKLNLGHLTGEQESGGLPSGNSPIDNNKDRSYRALMESKEDLEKIIRRELGAKAVKKA